MNQSLAIMVSVLSSLSYELKAAPIGKVVVPGVSFSPEFFEL